MDKQELRPNQAGKAERLLAWTAMLYGLTILNPWTNVFTTYYVYGGMQRLLPNELVWGGVITCIGLAQLVSWNLRSRWVRIATSLSASLMWMSLSALFILGGLLMDQKSLFTALTSPGVLMFTAWAIFETEICVELFRRR